MYADEIVRVHPKQVDGEICTFDGDVGEGHENYDVPLVSGIKTETSERM